MKKNKKKKMPQSNKSKKILLSYQYTILFYGFAFFLTAVICYKADINREHYFIIMTAITVISSLFGGFRLTMIIKEKGLINGILGAIPIAVITLLSALVFSEGILTAKIVIPIALSLVCGAVSGTAAVNLRR